jgi:hypothetical protein
MRLEHIIFFFPTFSSLFLASSIFFFHVFLLLLCVFFRVLIDLRIFVFLLVFFRHLIHYLQNFIHHFLKILLKSFRSLTTFYVLRLLVFNLILLALFWILIQLPNDDIALLFLFRIFPFRFVQKEYSISFWEYQFD